MPPKLIIDPTTIDFDNPVADKDAIYNLLPHRFEFERLDAIVSFDDQTGLIAGYHDAREDDFWVKGHIPGNPLFPGVLMIETAAQLVSYSSMSLTGKGKTGFLGFSAVDNVKFRGSVKPGDRLVMVGEMVENRPRRCKGLTQGFVDGKMVFEGLITGMWL